jgi:hypothetical protein
MAVVLDLFHVLDPLLVLELIGRNFVFLVHFLVRFVLLGIHKLALDILGLVVGLVWQSVLCDDVEGLEVHSDAVLVDGRI